MQDLMTSLPSASPATKNYSASNVNNAKVEKPCVSLIKYVYFCISYITWVYYIVKANREYGWTSSKTMRNSKAQETISNFALIFYVCLLNNLLSISQLHFSTRIILYPQGIYNSPLNIGSYLQLLQRIHSYSN